MIISELQLANGKKVDVTTGSVVRPDRSTEGLLHVPSGQEAIAKVMAVKKRLIDLPAPPAQMNGIAVIISYALLGMSDEEIGIALGLTLEQVARIMMSDVYMQVKQEIIDSILLNDTDNVRQIFVQGAKGAAKKVISLASSAEDEKVQLKASQDILDRAGHRPVDVHEHRVSLEGGLRIEHIDKKELDVPTITINGDAT